SQRALVCNATIFYATHAASVARVISKPQLGHTPIIVNSPPQANAVSSNTTVIFFGTPESARWLSGLAPASCYAGWESHCVVAMATTSFGYPAIVSTGKLKLRKYIINPFYRKFHH